MSHQNLTVGDPFQSRCTKCRKVTAHTVVATADDLPTELQCNKCLHQSAFRTPADRRPVDLKKAAREEWSSLRPGMDISRAQDYSMTGSYKPKTLVNHPVFGLGVVQHQSGLQKMLVLFADGEKIMRCK